MLRFVVATAVDDAAVVAAAVVVVVAAVVTSDVVKADVRVAFAVVVAAAVAAAATAVVASSTDIHLFSCPFHCSIKFKSIFSLISNLQSVAFVAACKRQPLVHLCSLPAG